MGQNECAAKVGAGETVVCECCGLPLAQSLDETDVCQCPGGLLDAGVDGEEKRKGDARWFAETYLKIRECSRAKEDELRAKFEAVIRESVSAALQEARLQLAREIEPLLLSIQRKAQDLQSLQPESAGAQGLLEDVRALSEAIGKTS